MAVIRKTRNGKWELDFYVDKNRKRVTFDSRREAEEAKRDLLLGAHRDAIGASKPKTIRDAVKFYFEKVSVGKASHQNERRYFLRLEKFLRNEGIIMVHEISSMHLAAFRAERVKEVKNSTANREWNTYHHFFESCIEWECIGKNPCTLERLPEKKNPHRVWTDDEFKLVVSQIPQWSADVMLAIYWTGAGPSEIARITWADVDLEARRLLIRRFKGSGDEIRRYMPLPDDFIAFLKAKRDFATRAFKAKMSDRVFLNAKREPINPRMLAQAVRRVVIAKGLPEGTVPYGVRHKFATELLEANVGEDQVRRLMGHRSVRTLIENYSHIRDKALNEAMSVRANQASNVIGINENNNEKRGGNGR